MSSLRPDQILKRKEVGLIREIEEDGVVLLPSLGEVMVLNGSALRVWQMLDGKRTIAYVATTIALESGVGVAEVTEDTLQFAEQLVEKGFAVPDVSVHVDKGSHA